MTALEASFQEALACVASVPVQTNFFAFWPRENWGKSTPIRRFFALASIFAWPECGKIRSYRNACYAGKRGMSLVLSCKDQEHLLVDFP